MTVHHDDGHVQIHHGDCLNVLRQLPDNSVDSVCTDPPYGLSNTDTGHVIDALTHWLAGDRTYLPKTKFGFMGSTWDAFIPPVAVWDECMRVLKPGGYALVFAGTRTQDLMGLALRLAGFEIRDSIAWLYGSGFPKSRDVGKDIDRARHDEAAVLAVTSRLADLAAAAGITRGDVDERMGTSDMGGWWLSRLLHRCACPSVENWTRLRDLIPGATELDAEVWRLNGRKGTPGEAWERREVIGRRTDGAANGSVIGLGSPAVMAQEYDVTAPATDAARRWHGWGTAIKPSHEPIVVARKPLSEPNVAGNVLRYGTGALNIDATRIGTTGGTTGAFDGAQSSGVFAGNDVRIGGTPAGGVVGIGAGRWPANVVLDENQAAALDQQSGNRPGAVSNGSKTAEGLAGSDTFKIRERPQVPGYADQGGASRFFFTAERDFDCCDNGEHAAAADPLPIEGLRERFLYTAKAPKKERPTYESEGGQVAHPTVKPLALMRWLVKLVTPPGGTCLDPFAGSGATVEACMLEGFNVIGVEREAEYLPLIMQRVNRQYEARALVDLIPRPAPSLFDEDEGAA